MDMIHRDYVFWLPPFVLNLSRLSFIARSVMFSYITSFTLSHMEL
jgi:hypothetical protein